MIATAAVALVLLVGVSAAGLMAQPVVDGQTALGGRFIDAPVLGIVGARPGLARGRRPLRGRRVSAARC